MKFKYLLLILIMIVPVYAANQGGNILALEGKVQVQRAKGEDWIDASVGMAILSSDKIKTMFASSAIIELKDKSRITVAENSVITFSNISNKKKMNIKLNFGGLNANVFKKNLNEKKSFKVSTPVAVAGVRGTNFEVSEGTEGSGFLVIEGVVEVESKGSKIVLKAKEAVKVTKTGEMGTKEVNVTKTSIITIPEKMRETMDSLIKESSASEDTGSVKKSSTDTGTAAGDTKIVKTSDSAPVSVTAAGDTKVETGVKPDTGAAVKKFSFIDDKADATSSIGVTALPGGTDRDEPPASYPPPRITSPASGSSISRGAAPVITLTSMNQSEQNVEAAGNITYNYQVSLPEIKGEWKDAGGNPVEGEISIAIEAGGQSYDRTARSNGAGQFSLSGININLDENLFTTKVNNSEVSAPGGNLQYNWILEQGAGRVVSVPAPTITSPGPGSNFDRGAAPVISAMVPEFKEWSKKNPLDITGNITYNYQLSLPEIKGKWSYTQAYTLTVTAQEKDVNIYVKVKGTANGIESGENSYSYSSKGQSGQLTKDLNVTSSDGDISLIVTIGNESYDYSARPDNSGEFSVSGVTVNLPEDYFVTKFNNNDFDAPGGSLSYPWILEQGDNSLNIDARENNINITVKVKAMSSGGQESSEASYSYTSNGKTAAVLKEQKHDSIEPILEFQSGTVIDNAVSLRVIDPAPTSGVHLEKATARAVWWGRDVPVTIRRDEGSDVSSEQIWELTLGLPNLPPFPPDKDPPPETIEITVTAEDEAENKTTVTGTFSR